MQERPNTVDSIYAGFKKLGIAKGDVLFVIAVMLSAAKLRGLGQRSRVLTLLLLECQLAFFVWSSPISLNTLIVVIMKELIR